MKILLSKIQHTIWKQRLQVLCTFALILWGASGNRWIMSLPILMVLEGRWIVKRRVRLDFSSVWSSFGILVGFYIFLSAWKFDGIQEAIQLVELLPLYFSPFLFAQIYSTNFTYIFSKKLQSVYALRRFTQNRSLTVYPFYLIACILAISSSFVNGFWLLGGLACLTSIVLLYYRPSRFKKRLTIGLLILALFSSYFVANHLFFLRKHVSESLVAWVTQFQPQHQSPWGHTWDSASELNQPSSSSGSSSHSSAEASKRLGHAGSLPRDVDQSLTDLNQRQRPERLDQIRFRVAPVSDLAGGRTNLFPLRLREASYNQFQSGRWMASDSEFSRIRPPLNRPRNWPISLSNPESNIIRVSERLARGIGVLKLPLGTSTIERLTAHQVAMNQYGAVKLRSPFNAIAYNVRFNNTETYDSPPTEQDLDVPLSEQPALQQALDSLDLSGKSDAEIIAIVSNFFDHGFQYSLDPQQPNPERTPLTSFLLDHRTGHCELYGTATTLLLRQAGIPARYAVGYVAREYSSIGRQYLVRVRHAHAWSLAFVEGQWREVDNTPSARESLNAEKISPWQVVSDLLDLLVFQAELRLSQYPWLFWAGLIGTVAAVFKLGQLIRQRFGKRLSIWLKCRQRSQLSPPRTIASPESVDLPGLDSEFFKIEARLMDLGVCREPNETMSQWLRRSQMHFPELCDTDLDALIQLHYRYRFDPKGLAAAERKQLYSLSEKILEQLSVGSFSQST